MKRVNRQALFLTVQLILATSVLLAAVADEEDDNIAGSFYTDDDSVVELSDETFHEKVVASRDVWMVEFYTKSCQPCAMLAPEVRKLAENMDGIVKIGAVDCEKNPKLVAASGIRTLPAFKVYGAEAQKNPYTHKLSKDAADYAITPSISAKSLAKFASSKLPDLVEMVTSDSWPALAQAAKEQAMPVALLFSTKDEAAPLYKALANTFHKRMRFTQAKSSDEALMAAFGAGASFPALFLVKPDGSREAYAGEYKAPPMAAYLEPLALPREQVEEPNAAGAGSAKEKKPSSPLPVWDSSNYNKEVLEVDPPVAVFFHNGGEACAATVEESVKSVAQGLLFYVKVGMVNLTAHPGLAAGNGLDKGLTDGSRCFQLALFPAGANKEEVGPDLYSGADLSSPSLRSFIAAAIPDRVHRLTGGSQLDAFLVASPGLPKFILFTDKSEVPLAYQALAAQFSDRGVFCYAHSSQEDIAPRFSVQRYPSLIALHTGGPHQPKQGPEGVQFRIEHFPGALKIAFMHRWVAALVAALGLDGQQEPAVARKLADIPQVSTRSGFEELCVKAGGLCVLGFLGGQAMPVEAQLDVLKGAAAATASSAAFHFGWVDHARQHTFGSALGVLASDLPTVVVLSGKKLRSVTMPPAQRAASFEASSLLRWLDSVLSGKTSTHPLPQLPYPVDGGESAALPEEVVEAVEEEFSLDDIMGETVEASLTAQKEEILRQAALEEEERKKDKKKKKKKKSGKDEL
eukprot:jgi/Mesvir1/14773/Mv05414-RA.1